MCDHESFDKLNERVDGLESRVAKVESSVSSMRSESAMGFRDLHKCVDSLAHDFGDRMNNLDKRIVAEKEKWGDVLRSVVIWTVRVLLAGCAVAMGITLTKEFFK